MKKNCLNAYDVYKLKKHVNIGTIKGVAYISQWFKFVKAKQTNRLFKLIFKLTHRCLAKNE